MKHNTEIIYKRTAEQRQRYSEAKRGCKNPYFGKLSPKSNSDGGYRRRGLPRYDLYASKLEPAELCRRNEQDPNILEVKCTYCGKWYILTDKQVQSRAFIGIKGNDTHRFYCSRECKSECPIYWKQKYYKGQENYSSREVQPELRQLVFERDNYTCQKCGSTCSLHCHHIDPVVSNPIESADIDNCITFCKDCHGWSHTEIEGCGYGELRNCA